MGALNGLGVVAKVTGRLGRLGLWYFVSSYAQGKLKNQSNELIREFDDGVKVGARKLRILRDE